ncbi:MAG: dihydropteroate synthase [Gammaproteobacteria bacterium]
MKARQLLNGKGPLIMGILNVTPDSFSEGGRYASPKPAISHALEMAKEGADLIDVGGESTRPGSERVPAFEQRQRVVPVIEGLRQALPDEVGISIDTTLGEVAEAALDAGAEMINDISAGRDDASILALAAQRQVPICLMHMQGTPSTMQQDPQYGDVVDEIRAFLLERADSAIAAGIPREHIIIDPGIGFGKTREHNLTLLKNLPRFVGSGYPVLLGASRKRFMGAICNESQPSSLVGATCASTAIGIAAGVRIFRVHDVAMNRQAADVAWAIKQA